MTKDHLVKALRHASTYVGHPVPELVKSRNIAALDLLDRLEQHAELIAELLTEEELSIKPIKAKLVYSK